VELTGPVPPGKELATYAPGCWLRRLTGHRQRANASLRDVPRKATVTAVTDVRPPALDRERFLAGIGASPRSGQEAEPWREWKRSSLTM
jgi:CRP-like cAMP-binding protein